MTIQSDDGNFLLDFPGKCKCEYSVKKSKDINGPMGQ